MYRVRDIDANMEKKYVICESTTRLDDSDSDCNTESEVAIKEEVIDKDDFALASQPLGKQYLAGSKNKSSQGSSPGLPS